jgi:hypothetical protein
MSFSLTEPQLLAGTKDVTRRLRWQTLLAGAHLTAIRKAMGLRRGERQAVLCEIEVLSVRWEPLDTITADECRREGFPEMTPAEFIAFFCAANGCNPETVVNRIEFRCVREAGE